jgi:tetratricopeptide (TPR) repeat protein
MRSRRALGLVLSSILLGGCVYYNGMYNANRLAKSARKAERDGRTFEANNLWGQVATKAESVVVRHPTSKYAEEASVLRGVALARLGQCDEALTALSRAPFQNKTNDLTEDALLATGRCQLAVGNVAAGEAAYSTLLDSKNRERRREALLQHARVLRQSGRHEEALQALKGLRDPRADEERILALAGAGHLPEALALADSFVARRDSLRPWDSLVVIMGRENPEAASRLVDHIRPLPVRTPELMARRLLDDGMRLMDVDTARAAARFREAAAVGGSTDAAGRANLELVVMSLRGARQVEDLPAATKALDGIASRFQVAAYPATQLSATIQAIDSAASAGETPLGDLRLFLAAEAARDSLRAPVLAEALLRRILQEYPNSSYSAKVVLAVQQLNPAWADSAKALLDGPYFQSPYMAMIRGESSDGYRQLEDSLGAFAATLAVKAAPGGVRRVPVRGAPVRRAPPPRDDVDADAPGRTRRTPGSTAVPVQ